MAAFLDKDGLTYLWGKIKNLVNNSPVKSHTHDRLTSSLSSYVELYCTSSNKNHWFKPAANYPTNQIINLGSAEHRTWDNIYAEDGLYVGGRKYGQNNTLWSGAWYGQADQTLTLSEAVSSQPHGIVLVFSYYDGGAKNNNWNSFFVPKQLVASHGGTSMNFFLTRSGMVQASQKCLSISNTTIGGYANNTDVTSGANVTLKQKSFVLRYVYGI